MSCFETSVFTRNRQLIQTSVLKLACRSLGWRCEMNYGETYVYLPEEVGQTEPVMIVREREVVYNGFFRGGGRMLLPELRHLFYKLEWEYARRTVTQVFEAQGFQPQPPRKRQTNNRIVDHFLVVGRSRMPGEEQEETRIHVYILADGSVVTDSNYIPHDLHEKADQAMLELARAFGCYRREGKEIKRKPVPEEYKGKTFCSVSGKVGAQVNNYTSVEDIIAEVCEA